MVHSPGARILAFVSSWACASVALYIIARSLILDFVRGRMFDAADGKIFFLVAVSRVAMALRRLNWSSVTTKSSPASDGMSVAFPLRAVVTLDGSFTRVRQRTYVRKNLFLYISRPSFVSKIGLRWVDMFAGE